jgi:hypothetical protein
MTDPATTMAANKGEADTPLPMPSRSKLSNRRRIPYSAGKGQMSNKSLSISEVKEVIYSYQDSEVTNQLYAFGSVLLGEIQDRAKQIDGKAVMVLGWSLAVLAFWFTQAQDIRGFIEFIFAAASTVLALLAAAFSYKARRITIYLTDLHCFGAVARWERA